MKKLFGELKRRNVFRVTAAYLVIGWVLLQVADALFPVLDLPDWSVRLVLGLLVLGFPVALVSAWAFEFTADGVRRDPGGENDDPAGLRAARRLDIATLVAVVIAIALFGWQAFRPSGVAGDSPSTAAAPRPSVAVLAFRNMSPDPENAYFAEGISEEILNVLSRIRTLRVASRTSAFSFEGTDTPIPEIAAQLGVGHVLEGSVRRQGNRVRITAQLIEARTDTHLWAQSFDSDLDDIFLVQQQIASAIAEQLIGTLGVAQISVEAPTENLAAYEKFLRGRQKFFRRGHAALRDAITELETAVAEDPEFAAAWSYLAASLDTLPGYVWMDEAEFAQHQSRAAAAARRALALDPGQALAVAVLGQVASHSDRQEQLRRLRRAAQMAPDDAGILMWLGDALYLTGAYLDEALPALERARRLDPLSGINNGVLGIAYLGAGQRELGRQHIVRGAELGWRSGEWTLLLDLLRAGELQAGIELLRDEWLAPESAWTAGGEKTWAIHEQVLRGELSGQAFDDALSRENLEIEVYWRFLYYRIMDDHDRVFDTFEIFPNVYWFRQIYIPGGRAYMEHPRMIDVAERYGLLPVWETEGYPFGCSPGRDEGRMRLRCGAWPE